MKLDKEKFIMLLYYNINQTTIFQIQKGIITIIIIIIIPFNIFDNDI